MLDQETAEKRPHRPGDRREARPCADSPASVLMMKRRADNRKTARHEQRCADSLQSSRKNQLIDIRCKAAPHRCGGEKHDSGSEYPPSAINVAERSSNQYQRGEEESITLHNPLRVNHGGIQVSLQRRQREIDYTAVDKCQTRSENCRRQNPWSGGRRARSG